MNAFKVMQEQAKSIKSTCLVTHESGGCGKYMSSNKLSTDGKELKHSITSTAAKAFKLGNFEG